MPGFESMENIDVLEMQESQPKLSIEARLQRQIVRMEKQIEEESEATSTALKIMESMNRQMAKLRSELISERLRNEMLLEENKQLESKNKEVNEENAEIHRQKAILECDIMKLKYRANYMKVHEEKKEEEHMDHIAELKKRLRTMSSELSKERTRIIENEKTIHRLTCKFEDGKKAFDGLETENVELLSLMVEKDKRICQMIQKGEEMQQKLNKLSNVVMDLRTAIIFEKDECLHDNFWDFCECDPKNMPTPESVSIRTAHVHNEKPNNTSTSVIETAESRTRSDSRGKSN